MSIFIQEAIVLAGGLGTRLRSAVPDVPKCMAPVNGTPFVDYVINYLQQQGIRRFIFALGYKNEVFDTFLRNKFLSDEYQVSVEAEPLGTGGAILHASRLAQDENVLIVNGDTLFRISLSKLSTAHLEKKADCTIALKPMQTFVRYGAVELNEDMSVTRFKEKQYFDKGLINGGVYALSLPSFCKIQFPKKFSFEQDYLEQYYKRDKIFGMIQDTYFIDIGIPEDYKRAAIELHPSIHKKDL